jgi:hypothetical protein
VIKLIQVIVADDILRGSGKDNDPWRRITQYWSTDGNLLAEVDTWQQDQDSTARAIVAPNPKHNGMKEGEILKLL